MGLFSWFRRDPIDEIKIIPVRTIKYQATRSELMCLLSPKNPVILPQLDDSVMIDLESY